jgi:hypothetical protein
MFSFRFDSGSVPVLSLSFIFRLPTGKWTGSDQLPKAVAVASLPTSISDSGSL